ncbi:MAG: hypothetical protein H7X97_00750, partial [Opitutaceae bacterium]|nr:hypothetical protein [Verrucomicrobiales bacterium]
TVTIRSAINGPELISFDYADSRVWPITADGLGHSLVPLPRALVGQTNGSLAFPGNWQASSFIKGSSGRADPPIPDAIVLNEIVAHTDFINELDSNDWIELHNRAATNYTFGLNWFLSDNAADLRKWMIPSGTVLPASGFVVFDEVTGFHNPITIGFGLTKSGEQVFLSYLPGDGSDRVVDAVRFPAEENDWSWGRAANSPDIWVPLTPRTRGQTNGIRPIVPRLTEIHYNPAPLVGFGTDNTNHEFIEITAPAGTATVFSNTNGTWRLNGDISFDIPTNFTLVAGQRVLAVSFSPTNAALLADFKSAFGITNSALPILGPYQGKLSNRSGRITLEKPQAPDLPGDPVGWILVDETVFADQAPWTPLADGTGRSLQLLVSDLPGSDDFAWIAAAPKAGSATTALRDTDGDGAPDLWEQANSFDPFNAADAALDSDGDGASNVSEYFAGTNPHDAASVLRLRLDRQPPNPLPEISLKWLAFPSRFYDIQYRAAFGADSWQTISNFSTSLSNQLIDVRLPMTNQAEGYFRIKVQP